MRQFRERLHRSRTLAMLAALVLMWSAAASRVQAQTVLALTDIDWTLDRGPFAPPPPIGPNNDNAVPLRRGHNNFNALGNSPAQAAPKWIWPTSQSRGERATVDNPDAAGNQKIPDPNEIPMPPGFQATLLPSPGAWVFPAIQNRSPNGGYSFPTELNEFNFGDYAYALATHDDFVIDRPAGQPDGPITAAEVRSFPNARPQVYAAVHNRLISPANVTEVSAVWSSGTLATTDPNNTFNPATVTRYAVQIHSPGDGTIVDPNTGLGRANVTRAFVRISWGANINDPLTSRIFVVDLGPSGWTTIQGEDLGPALIPYDPAVQTPIRVTLYSLTPDNVNDTSIYPNGRPLVTADAVRFVPQDYVSRLLGPPVSAKVLDTVSATLLPVFYIAREEAVLDTETLRSWPNPIAPVAANAQPTAPDPTASTTRAVFYCIDNQNTLQSGGDTADPTDDVLNVPNDEAKVRWRFLPPNDGNTGTATASGLIANVRCRDGQTRAMLYFLTTNRSDSSGHIYALDPSGDPATKATTGYWAYPSVRPKVAVNLQTPSVIHDPNYTNFVQGPYPAIAQPDINVWPDLRTPLNGFRNMDGDIIANPTGGQTVRADSRVPTFGGVRSSPIVIDDPSNPTGPQILVVGNMNGRIYAFDAGGRLDFQFDGANKDDFTLNQIGTTARVSTWPRLGADAWRTLTTPTAGVPDDEEEKGAFPGSPAYRPDANAAESPVVIGSNDGRVYALVPRHDVVTGIINGTPTHNQRLSWQYPSNDSSLEGGISTCAIFKNRIYFTSDSAGGGRVYALNETPPGGYPIAGSSPKVASLSWVYPFTDNPPEPSDNPPDPTSNDPNLTTVGIDPGFRGSPPLLMDGLLIRPNGNLPDLCYVVQGNSALLALLADPPANNGRTTVYASGETEAGAVSSRSAPIVATIAGQSGFLTGTFPAVIFSDDDGSTWALRADPDPGIANDTLLEVMWEERSFESARPASAILSNGMLVVGDEAGQLFAYGQGANTVGRFGPRFGRRGVGYVSIDARTLDIYDKPAFDRFMLTNRVAAAATPAKTTTGTNYANTLEARASNLDNTTTGPVATDWGNYLYIAASGVYHHVPTSDGSPTPTVPIITVRFRITQPGRASQTQTIQVPAVLPERIAGQRPVPDDAGILDGEANGIAIYGLDPADNQSRLFTGPGEGAYPWVAKIRIPIVPNPDRPFVPGALGYSVSVEAEVRQSGIQLDGGPTIADRRRSNRLTLGQRDYLGLSVEPQRRPRLRDVTEDREIYVTNPLSLTVRGFTGPDMTGGNLPNVIGWGPDVDRAANKQELLGNANRLVLNPASGIGGAIKPLFAPFGFVGDGTSKTYTGINNAGQGQAAQSLFIADRSNLVMVTGRATALRVYAQPFVWTGGPTSVMNPLPWERMPTDQNATPDYPNIGTENLDFLINSQDALEVAVPLKPPIQQGADPADRVVVPTEAQFVLRVPRFQPANVNRGQVTVGGVTFGANLRDMGGNNRSNVVGPIINATGQTVAVNHPLAAPSLGYRSLVITTIEPIAGTRRTTRLRPEDAFAFTKGGTLVNPLDRPMRGFETGAAVPPNFKMAVAEQTLDIGKVPHGLGYSALRPPSGNLPQNTNPNYHFPFAPTNLNVRQYLSDYWRGRSPWDADTSPDQGVLQPNDPAYRPVLGDFFRPFTLVNNSNVNLVDLRLAKLVGRAGAAIGTASLSNSPPENVAASARLVSDQVNSLTTPPLFALPFLGTGGVGNIGVVSSLDHTSTNSANTAERSFWPLPNPTVTANGIAAAGLPTSGLRGWAAGSQSHPVAVKARPGDQEGLAMTIPAKPYDLNASLGADAAAFVAALRPPQVSVAVPLGTPAGTYANPLFAFEDNLPFQWREWLATNNQGAATGADSDGILNTNADPNVSERKIVEAYANPTFTLKVTVREARLTKDATRGTFGQIDPLASGPIGADLLPAAFRNIAQNNSNINLLWTTNRQPNNSPFRANGFPTADAPYELAYATLPATTDFFFARPGGSDRLDDLWWTAPQAYPGYDTGSGLPAGLNNLFPSGPNALGLPFLPGNATPQTARFASPAFAQAALSSGALDPQGETWVFWQGTVDKTRAVPGQALTQVDSRTFYAPWDAQNNRPDPNNVQSFLNDPALTKLSPKPLLIKLDQEQGLPALKFLYLFWHAGNQSQTGLYYNVNPQQPNSAFLPAGWSRDQKLPTPGALVWQSDPSPVYRRVPDPNNGNALVDAIDIVYTGVLKNRQSIEALLTRYRINRVPPQSAQDPPLGALTVMPLPAVQQETLARVGRTATWQARDAAWTQRGANAVELFRLRSGAIQKISSDRGRFDAASGLMYYDSALGGQIVVDTRSGTVSFPNIPPGMNDALLASYRPQVMRLNASRAETNIIRTGAIPAGWQQDRAFQPNPAVTSPGDNTRAIAILDRGIPNQSGQLVNPRAGLTSPQVVFPGPNAILPTLDRLWVVYRKTDVSGNTPSTLYYKSLRLLARLPRPALLTAPDSNGNQQIAGLSVAGNLGPYEVDWVRGRVYFTQIDEGREVSINYAYARGSGGLVTTGALPYRVAWGDEISSAIQPQDPEQPFVDQTTPETTVPMDVAVNEGQVAAFKDPFSDKLWLFWASTRARTTDLYYMTLAPQLYARPASER